ncbi:MAG: PKD domain-containing protein [Bacteroidales bacterium]|nr:PKD domain-containing protein [Bacteroidales bacterium]
MKKLAIIMAAMLVAFTACKKEEQQEQKNEPIANFEIKIGYYYYGSGWDYEYVEYNGRSIQSRDCPLYIGIKNTSENADSYQWEWGDGKYDGHTHPTHQYNSAGTYTITLTAENSDGYTSTKSKTITLE